MRLDLSYVMVSGDRLEKMIHFLFDISDRVELVSSRYDEMTKEEYDNAVAEDKHNWRDMYFDNGYSDENLDDITLVWRQLEENIRSNMTEEEYDEEQKRNQELIKDIEEKEKRIRENSYILAENIPNIVEEKFKGLTCLSRQVTCKTHCTIGGAKVVYCFPVSNELKNFFLNMELLTWPLKTEEGVILADDPAFYKDGELVCSICSHESYIFLYLNEEQKSRFDTLGIPFRLEIEVMENEKREFPFSSATICVLPMEYTVTTLLGCSLFDVEEELREDYFKFYEWFQEQEDILRKQTLPCKKSVVEIIYELNQRYLLEPYHSQAIKLQCRRHGWDDFFNSPLNTEEYHRRCVNNQNIPKLEPFLYRLYYQGEAFIVGGEYYSDYIFVDTPDVENSMKNLLETKDEVVYGFMERRRLTEPLFQLIREINSIRGIDEYERYSCFFRTYIQLLRYEDIVNHRFC